MLLVFRGEEDPHGACGDKRKKIKKFARFFQKNKTSVNLIPTYKYNEKQNKNETRKKQ